jgi:hypothetical protein
MQRVRPRPAPRSVSTPTKILLDLCGLSEAELGALHDAGVVAGQPATFITEIPSP